MLTIFRATFWVLECESHTAGARQQPPQVQHAQKMRSEMVTAETEQDTIRERVAQEEEHPWHELGMDDACHESVKLGANDVWVGRGDVVGLQFVDALDPTVHVLAAEVASDSIDLLLQVDLLEQASWRPSLGVGSHAPAVRR